MAEQAQGSRFAVESVQPAIDREQLSVRSLGELLELQKQCEEQKDPATARSLGELLAEPSIDSPAARRRSASTTSKGDSQGRPRSRSGAGILARPDRTIVIGIDGSDQCKTAFHWYVDELWREGDRLLLVHIYELPSLPTFEFNLKSGVSLPTELWQDKIAESMQEAERLCIQYEAECNSHKINYLTVTRSGSPGVILCKVAEEYNADLIMVARRGHSLLRRTVLGSVSAYIINHASIPVTVVPHSLKRNRKDGK